MKRGDVILVRFPHPSGQRGKERPAVVVQSDAYASAVSTLVVAEVTKNLTMNLPFAKDRRGFRTMEGGEKLVQVRGEVPQGQQLPLKGVQGSYVSAELS